MKIPKELGEKVKRWNELTQEAAQLFQEVVDWLNENTGADAVSVESLFITKKPTGRLQEEDEYCDQHQGWIEDDYHGNYYHQIEGTDEYVGYYFTTY